VLLRNLQQHLIARRKRPTARLATERMVIENAVTGSAVIESVDRVMVTGGFRDDLPVIDRSIEIACPADR
jgi:hypothetical protein